MPTLSSSERIRPSLSRATRPLQMVGFSPNINISASVQVQTKLSAKTALCRLDIAQRSCRPRGRSTPTLAKECDSPAPGAPHRSLSPTTSPCSRKSQMPLACHRGRNTLISLRKRDPPTSGPPCRSPSPTTSPCCRKSRTPLACRRGRCTPSELGRRCADPVTEPVPHALRSLISASWTTLIQMMSTSPDCAQNGPKLVVFKSRGRELEKVNVLRGG